MKVKIEDGGACRKLLRVSTVAEEVAQEYANILAAYAKSAKVPGFRKGKVPTDVVEKRYRNHIIEDTKERLIPELYRKALEQESIEPVAVLGVDNVTFDKNHGMDFTVTLDVAPDFKLPKYKRIALSRKAVDVTEKDVEESLHRFRESAATYEDVAERSVQDGDLVLIDYSATLDDKPLSEIAGDCTELAAGKDFWALVGEPEFLPGLPKGLIGCAIGDRKEITVHFPQDYHVASVAGKDATYTVDVKNIREKILPELNDEFAKQFQADSVQDLKDKIREQLRKNAENSEARRLKEEIGKYLLAKTKCDVPQSIVDDETRRTAQDIVQRTAMQGATKQQIEDQKDTILNTAAQASRDRVKLSYVLTKIAEKEDVQVSDEELDQRIKDMALYHRTTPERLRSELEKRNSMEGLRNDIKTEKTLDFVLQQAKIKG